MLYMVPVCMQNCLLIFKIDLIGKFFKPWLYPYNPGMLYNPLCNLDLTYAENVLLSLYFIKKSSFQ